MHLHSSDIMVRNNTISAAEHLAESRNPEDISATKEMSPCDGENARRSLIENIYRSFSDDSFLSLSPGTTGLSPIPEEDEHGVSSCSSSDSNIPPPTELISSNTRPEIQSESEPSSPEVRSPAEEISPCVEKKASRSLIEDIYSSLSDESCSQFSHAARGLSPMPEEDKKDISSCFSSDHDDSNTLPSTDIITGDELQSETEPSSLEDISLPEETSPCGKMNIYHSLIEDIYSSFSDENCSSMSHVARGLSPILEENEDSSIPSCSSLHHDGGASTPPAADPRHRNTRPEIKPESDPCSPHDMSLTEEISPCAEEITRRNLIEDIYRSFSDNNISSLWPGNKGLSPIPEVEEGAVSSCSSSDHDDTNIPPPTELIFCNTRPELQSESEYSSPEQISRTKEVCLCGDEKAGRSLIEDICSSFSDDSLSSLSPRRIPEEHEDAVSSCSSSDHDDVNTTPLAAPIHSNNTGAEPQSETEPSSPEDISLTEEISPSGKMSISRSVIEDICSSFSDESLSSDVADERMNEAFTASDSDAPMAAVGRLSLIPEEDTDDVSTCSSSSHDESNTSSGGISINGEMDTCIVIDIFSIFSDDNLSASTSSVILSGAKGKSPITADDDDDDDLSSCSSFDEDESYMLPPPTILHNDEVQFDTSVTGDLEKLGAGQYGMVYKGRRVSSSDIIVCKELTERPAVGDRIHEAKLLIHLVPTGVVPETIGVVQNVRGTGHHGIIQRFVPDLITLSDHLDSPGDVRDKDTLLDMAISIILAITEIHKYNVIHNDIKPDNILVHKCTARVLLIDFGLATYKAGVGLVAHGEGTSHPHVAPESFVSETTYKSDIYSLGFILWLFNKLLHSSVLGGLVRMCRKEYPPSRPTLGYIVRRLRTLKHFGMMEPTDSLLSVNDDIDMSVAELLVHSAITSARANSTKTHSNGPKSDEIDSPSSSRVGNINLIEDLSEDILSITPRTPSC